MAPEPTCEASDLAAARTASASAPLSPSLFIRRMGVRVPGAHFGYFFDHLSDYSAAQYSGQDSPTCLHPLKSLVVREIRLEAERAFGGGNGVFAGIFTRLVDFRTVVYRYIYSLLSGYKSNRLSWLENTSEFSWES